MFDDLEFIENERKRTQASHDYAVKMARHHGKAIISPRSSVTYTVFSMLIGGLSLTGFSWGCIAPFHMSETVVKLILLAMLVIGGVIGFFIASSIFYIDETLDTNMLEPMAKIRNTVKSTYFK